MGWGGVGEDDVGEALWMGIVEEVGGSKSWGWGGGGGGRDRKVSGVGSAGWVLVLVCGSQ